jgi:hypothetical protein
LAIVSPNDQGFSLQDGLIRFKGKVWVGANTAIQTKDYPNIPFICHAGAFWDTSYLQENSEVILLERSENLNGILCSIVHCVSAGQT